MNNVAIIGYDRVGKTTYLKENFPNHIRVHFTAPKKEGEFVLDTQKATLFGLDSRRDYVFDRFTTESPFFESLYRGIYISHQQMVDMERLFIETLGKIDGIMLYRPWDSELERRHLEETDDIETRYCEHISYYNYMFEKIKKSVINWEIVRV